MNPLFRLVWTAALVGVVAFANRSASSDSDVSAESVRCELDPPRDVTGLEACVARFPSDVELWLDLGAAYEAAGRTGDAEAAYQRATAIDPRDAEPVRRLSR